MRNNDSTTAVAASVGITSLSAANAAVDTALEGTADMIRGSNGLFGKLWAMTIFPMWPVSFWFFWWKCKVALGTSIGLSVSVMILWLVIWIFCFARKGE